MRMLLAFSSTYGYQTRLRDIIAAFLHAEIDYPIYIEQSHCIEKPRKLVCMLHKSIYSLKIAPQRRQLKLQQTLHQMNFKRLKYNKNIFRNNKTFSSTYFNENMIISKNNIRLNQIIYKLASVFKLKDLGTMTKFLGININHKSNGIRINQKDKIKNLCDDMGMIHC